MMISLPDLHLLEIAGADALDFAHAQFSSDARVLADGAWQWSAWLSPQGRVRAFFQLIRDDAEHLRLLLRGGDAENLRAELARYVLRAKVSLRASDATVLGTDQATAGALALPGSPARWLTTGDRTGTVDSSAAARERWRLGDIRAGLPVLAADLVDQLLPQWLGLDRLGAVNVKKGCYPGQEVMSRLHFKGGNKRSLYRIELAKTEAPGTVLGAVDEAAVGLVIMSARREDDRVEALASLIDTAAGAAPRPGAPAIREITVLERFA
jgi:tRNA-modifying protein YgfZ